MTPKKLRDNLPASDAQTKNWITDGCVTPVKDQGQCGSCFDFAAIGAIEGAHCAAGNERKTLSEQFILDCETGQTGDMGCKGGLMENLYSWLVVSQAKIPLESDYPYQGAEKTCAAPQTVPGQVGISAWNDIEDDATGIQLCAHLNKYGPVGVAVQGSGPIQDYQGGIIDTDECGEELDHGVVLVGCVMSDAPAPSGGNGHHGTDCSNVPAGNERMWCNKGRHLELMSYKEICLEELEATGTIIETDSTSHRNNLALQCANQKIIEEVDQGTGNIGSLRDGALQVDHYILKNSWGTEYGEQGFFRVKKGRCGVHKMASYVASTTSA